MPRTKKAANASRTSSAVDLKEKQVHNAQIRAYVKNLDIEFKKLIENLRNECKNMKSSLAMVYQEHKLNCISISHKTVKELEASGASTTQFVSVSNLHSVLSASTAKKQQVPPTRTTRSSSRKRSAGDDEGYLTAGSRASSVTRQSRVLKKQTTANKRRSKSSSALQQQRVFKSQKELTTPLNRGCPPNMYGYITPKVKPNTPQAILRRPVLGEIAYSMEGSPLMTEAVMTKNANVNIPLSNGRMISIQPERGLRLSLLPNMGDETLDQVRLLCDNLTRVLESNNK